MRVYVYVYVCVCLCVHACVCVHVCACVCACVCVHVCACVCACVCVCVHAWCLSCLVSHSVSGFKRQSFSKTSKRMACKQASKQARAMLRGGCGCCLVCRTNPSCCWPEQSEESQPRHQPVIADARGVLFVECQRNSRGKAQEGFQVVLGSRAKPKSTASRDFFFFGGGGDERESTRAFKSKRNKRTLFFL